MKAVGIIAEYNPFHNGHAFQIQKARELSNADCVVIAMSGNFVQRGAPAILDKFSRTAMALAGGADFVFELPVLFSTASAEYFAAAGIALLNALGCVDSVCFGAETPDLALLGAAAAILAEEPELYTQTLSDCLKQGISFPSAREQAVRSCMTQTMAIQQTRTDSQPGIPSTVPYQNTYNAAAEHNQKLTAILQSPNNILALEYIKALIRQGSSIRPLPIQRRGAGYHTPDLGQEYCSASAIRRLLLEPSASYDLEKTLNAYLPESAARILLAADAHFMTEQDFSRMLCYKLLSERENGYAGYADSSPDLSNKILRALGDFSDYPGFCKRLKSKDITYTRISRLLLHILLNIKTSDYDSSKSCGFIPYLRLLGFQKKSSPLLREIQKNSSVPLIIRPARDSQILTPPAADIFQKDLFASDLYYGTLAQKRHIPWKNEYQRGIIVY